MFLVVLFPSPKASYKNSIQKEIKSILNSGNACYHSVQNLLSSSVLPKNIRIHMYSTVILPLVFYGCEIYSFKLMEECRLGVFENRALRRIFGSKRYEVTGEWRKLHNEGLMICIAHPICSGDQIQKNEISGACNTYG